MEKKRNWEIQYEKYKDATTQARFGELKNKFNSKTITREENDEYQKMKKIMENIPKVDNIKQYMEELETDLEILKEEYQSRRKEQEQGNIDQKISENSARREKLVARLKENQEKIRQSKNDEEVEKLKKENASIEEEFGEIAAEYEELQGKKTAHSQDTTTRETNWSVHNYSTQQLKDKCFEISTMLSKCNMVASNLMKGLSIESVRVKLEGWKDRKFTSKDPLPLTKKERTERQAKAQEQEKTQKIQETNSGAGIKNNADPIQVIHGANPLQQQTPAVVSEFAKAFPRLAKRFPNMENNFIGKVLLAVKKRLPNNKEVEGQGFTSLPTLDLDSDMDNNSNNQKSKREAFKDYVKYDVLVVADKGMEEAKAESIKNRKEKLAKLKESQEEKDR